MINNIWLCISSGVVKQLESLIWKHLPKAFWPPALPWNLPTTCPGNLFWNLPETSPEPYQNSGKCEVCPIWKVSICWKTAAATMLQVATKPPLPLLSWSSCFQTMQWRPVLSSLWVLFTCILDRMRFTCQFLNEVQIMAIADCSQAIEKLSKKLWMNEASCKASTASRFFGLAGEAAASCARSFGLLIWKQTPGPFPSAFHPPS